MFRLSYLKATAPAARQQVLARERVLDLNKLRKSGAVFLVFPAALFLDWPETQKPWPEPELCERAGRMAETVVSF